MATFVAKNSGGVEKNDNLKRVYFFHYGFNKWRQRLAGVQGFRLK